jgi:hypothetical protein
MDKKQPGRPKLYDTSSEKLEAFRKRLESAGFMRKEILVTKETWDQVTNLAKENGASVSDAASGLLEYGVHAFSAKKAAATVMYSRKQMEPSAAPVAHGPKPQIKPGKNPIADFFAKRKESAQSTSSDDSSKN